MKLVSPDKAHRRDKRRQRVLKTVAVLPSLATLGNLVCGLGAVYMCLLSQAAHGSDLFTRPLNSQRMDSIFPTYLAIGAYLLVMSMGFDALDGRLARLARRTTEFGAQLDSLADVVSFGVAPAALVLCIAHPPDVTALSPLARLYWRTEWVMAAVYVCCAALRLARFNVENEEDESAHMGFRGLPTPGAAGALVGVIIFHQDLLVGLASNWSLHLLGRMLPPLSMLLGLFMVSRFRYAHLVNTLLRGRRPFTHIVAIAIILLVGFVIQPQATIAVVAAGYAFTGPLAAAIRRIKGLPSMHTSVSLVDHVVSGPTHHDRGSDTTRSAL